MLYTESYREVAINLVEDEIIQRHPDGSPDHKLIHLMPTLNNYTDSYIRKCGAEVPLPSTFNVQQTQDKVSEVRENVLAKLRGYIDRVRDNSQSVPWLETQSLEGAAVTNTSE